MITCTGQRAQSTGILEARSRGRPLNLSPDAVVSLAQLQSHRRQQGLPIQEANSRRRQRRWRETPLWGDQDGLARAWGRRAPVPGTSPTDVHGSEIAGFSSQCPADDRSRKETPLELPCLEGAAIRLLANSVSSQRAL